MIVERDSATLGYVGEITKLLDADHHDVCKYVSRQDSNYRSVRDVIRSLVGQFKSTGTSKALETSFSGQTNHEIVLRQHDPNEDGEIMTVQSLLAMYEAPEDDLEYFIDRRISGSCAWILNDVVFQKYLDNTARCPQVLWLRGPPGAGKSVLSAFIVQHLRSLEVKCQYYFFRHGNQDRRSLSGLLKSLAFQLASQLPDYRHRLTKLAETGFSAQKAESRVLWQKLFVQSLVGIGISVPVYWVIDGLDEADSPQTLLNLLPALSNAGVPMRLIFISRETQLLATAFHRLESTINIQKIPLDDSGQDVRLYVEKEIEFIHATSELKTHIFNTIMSMAAGNFLWVHLVLKEIMTCISEADIERALKELPPELEPLYARMGENVAGQIRTGDLNLAKTILAWAICSRRPLTLQELSRALHPEYRPIDLSHTVKQVCGEFISISAKGNVTMIHDTAREYLTKTPEARLFISTHEAHCAAFRKCISNLLTTNPRIRANHNNSQPFLLYAATSWAYHLELSSAYRDRDSLVILAKFLLSPSVLAWIECLAIAGELRVLVHASKALTKFLEKRARIDSEQSPLTHQLQEKDILKQWAVDLTKIVGKFGTHLAAYPRSIYTLVPSFCPRDSILRHRFAKGNQNIPSSGLRLSGFSNTSWDDNLATFSVHHDSQPIVVKTLDNHFAILIADGMVILYHALTCQESRRFRHGERVLHMQLNEAGDRLVTYGYRTTKVWNVASALELSCADNPTGTKALAVTFDSNSTVVLACFEDRTVRQWSFVKPSGTTSQWDDVLGDAHFGSNHYNSPRSASFNQQGTQVALAYRGFPLSVWAVDFPGFVGRCERPGHAGELIWTEVQKVGWNPITGHVVGTYTDSHFFKWHPTDHDYHELSVPALNIACSRDGNLLVTTSGDGTLRIWNFHHFAMIYQLSCNTPVTDISFDPDGRRIYDLRESYCNVWEPNSLIRYAETDDRASETSSAKGSSGNISMASEMSSEMLEPITALALNRVTSAYCAGNDGGLVTFSAAGSEEVVELSQGFMTVDHIIWSADGTSLATSDLSGKVTVKVVEGTSVPKARTVFQTSTHDGIQQILLSPSGSHLLVYTRQSAQVWSVGTKSVVATVPRPNRFIRWADHNQADLVLCFGFSDVRMFRWTDLEEVKTFSINRTLIDDQQQTSLGDRPGPFRLDSIDWALEANDIDSSVDKTFLTPDGSALLVQTSQICDHHRRRKQFMVLTMNALSTDNPEKEITASPLPEHIRARIEIPLGFLDSQGAKGVGVFSAGHPEGAVLAFLDKDFWVCTGLLNGYGEVAVKRYFFLPRDWLNIESLELAAVTGDGVFMCPRNGEIGVVTGGLKDEWIE
jgi:WD40 repeat protein